MSSYSEGQTHQLADALEAAGHTTKHLTKLGQSFDLLVKLRLVLDGMAEIVIKSILELVNSEIKVSARERFVVADNFKKGNAGIHYLGDNFTEWFGKKVEENVPTATLTSRKLTQGSLDGPIKVELGDDHETFIAWLFQMLEVQADKCEGELLVNGYANIFYIDGRVVNARWFVGDGWRVDADEVSHPITWHDGHRVFSRNSVLKASETMATAQA